MPHSIVVLLDYPVPYFSWYIIMLAQIISYNIHYFSVSNFISDHPTLQQLACHHCGPRSRLNTEPDQNWSSMTLSVIL